MTTYTILDPAGRPTIRSNNPNRVIVMLEQGWTAVRHVFGTDVPVTLDNLTWVPERR